MPRRYEESGSDIGDEEDSDEEAPRKSEGQRLRFSADPSWPAPKKKTRVTKKPAETRMGSGKGSPEGYVAVVKPGRVMFEMSGVDETLAREAMSLAAQKLPIKTRFLSRGGCAVDEGRGSARAGRRAA